MYSYVINTVQSSHLHIFSLSWPLSAIPSTYTVFTVFTSLSFMTQCSLELCQLCPGSLPPSLHQAAPAMWAGYPSFYSSPPATRAWQQSMPDSHYLHCSVLTQKSYMLGYIDECIFLSNVEEPCYRLSAADVRLACCQGTSDDGCSSY